MSDRSESPRDRIRRGFARRQELPIPSIEAQRKAWEAAASSKPLLRGVTTQSMHCGGIHCLSIRPAGHKSSGTIVYVHGGGFTAGSSITHQALGAFLALAAGREVLLVDYRLAPEAPFPAARDDIIATVQWLVDRGTHSGSITLGADSSGGHVAVSAVLALRRHNIPIGSLFLLSPWLDLSLSGESFGQLSTLDPLVSKAALIRCRDHYLAGRDVHDREIDILNWDFRGLCPVLLHCGSDEILLSDSVQFAAHARTAQVDVDCVVWPDMWHVFHAWAPELPEANEAIGRIGKFVSGTAR